MNPLTDKHGEVRELTKEDLLQFKPASGVLPPALMEKLRGASRPVVEKTKAPAVVSVDAD